MNISNLRFTQRALQRKASTQGKTGKKGFKLFAGGFSTLKDTALIQWITANKKKAAALGTAAAMAVALPVGAHILNTDRSENFVEPPAQEQQYNQDVNSTNTTPSGTDFSMLADDLTQGIAVDETKTDEEIVEEIAAEKGLNLVTPGVIVTDSNGGKVAWETQEDYDKAVEAGIAEAPVGTEKVTVENGWLAPDNTVWQSQEDYENYIKGSKGEIVVEVEGNSWTAPDGSLWTSKEEYDKYVESQKGEVVTPVSNGDVVEVEGNSWLDPDGTRWSSKEEYLNFINGSNQIVNEIDYGNGEVTQNPSNIQKDQYGGYYDGGYYHAADGYIYENLNDYLSLINNNNNNAKSTYSTVDTYTDTTTYSNEYTDTTIYNEINSYVEETRNLDQYGGYVGEDGFYHASNNLCYVDVEAYLNDINSDNKEVTATSLEDGSIYTAETNDLTTYSDVSSTETEVVTTDTEEVTTTETTEDVEKVEEAKIVYDEYGGYVGEDGFYHAKDGFIYVSLQDYLNELLYGGELDNGNDEKTR